MCGYLCGKTGNLPLIFPLTRRSHPLLVSVFIFYNNVLNSYFRGWWREATVDVLPNFIIVFFFQHAIEHQPLVVVHSHSRIHPA